MSDSPTKTPQLTFSKCTSRYAIVLTKLPPVDQADFERLQGWSRASAGQDSPVRRQFTPVYAHKAYMQSLIDEEAVGDYTQLGQVSNEQRQ